MQTMRGERTSSWEKMKVNRIREQNLTPTKFSYTRKIKFAALTSVILTTLAVPSIAATTSTQTPIKHVVIVFDENASRTRKDNAPENLAILRRLALNIIRSHPASISLRQKIKTAGWNDTFLLGMLSHMR